MVLDTLVPRRVGELLMGLVAVEPVIALHGPRSVGKWLFGHLVGVRLAG